MAMKCKKCGLDGEFFCAGCGAVLATPSEAGGQAKFLGECERDLAEFIAALDAPAVAPTAPTPALQGYFDAAAKIAQIYEVCIADAEAGRAASIFGANSNLSGAGGANGAGAGRANSNLGYGAGNFSSGNGGARNFGAGGANSSKNGGKNSAKNAPATATTHDNTSAPAPLAALRENLARTRDFLAQDKYLEIAFVGTIKAGKSTLINALLRADLASADPCPETATLSKFAWGERAEFCVSFYSREEWASLWAQARDVRVFREKFASSGAAALRDKLVGAPSRTLPLSKAALESFTSSRFPEHYFVKEVIISSPDFPFSKNIMFVDTPGLNDPVPYRSNVTKDYLGRAKVVLFCNNVSAMNAEEVRTIFTAFDQTAGEPHRVYVVATHLDTLAGDAQKRESDWQRKKAEWSGYLTGAQRSSNSNLDGAEGEFDDEFGGDFGAAGAAAGARNGARNSSNSKGAKNAANAAKNAARNSTPMPSNSNLRGANAAKTPAQITCYTPELAAKNIIAVSGLTALLCELFERGEISPADHKTLKRLCYNICDNDDVVANLPALREFAGVGAMREQITREILQREQEFYASGVRAEFERVRARFDEFFGALADVAAEDYELAAGDVSQMSAAIAEARAQLEREDDARRQISEQISAFEAASKEATRSLGEELEAIIARSAK